MCSLYDYASMRGEILPMFCSHVVKNAYTTCRFPFLMKQSRDFCIWIGTVPRCGPGELVGRFSGRDDGK